MFGFCYLKAQPTQYVVRYKSGRPWRHGAGLSFTYFGPMATIAVVPTATVNEPFMFPEVTQDYQDVSIQGQVTYRVADPLRTAEMLDFGLNAQGAYASEDPKKLTARVFEQVRVAIGREIQAMDLRQALAEGPRLAARLRAALAAAPALQALGLEVLDLAVLAVKPKPETARALEAGAREALLRAADEAIHARRNAAVEQERVIRENELETEIAVETKKRQIAEEDLAGQIRLEEQRRHFVELAAANARDEADAKAYGIAATMKAVAETDARTLQALASTGMDPAKLMALAFRDLADNAGKIGQLTVTPDLLREVMGAH